MFENLTDRLEKSFRLIKGQGKITEVNISETMKDVRKALLDADVSYKIAKTFCDQVKQKAIGQDVLKAVRPEQMMIKIVHDELVELMGSDAADIHVKGNPGIVLVAACDTFRPAAIEQLKTLCGQISVECYSEDGVKDPISIAQNAIRKAKAEG